jgi:hypothetical protein
MKNSSGKVHNFKRKEIRLRSMLLGVNYWKQTHNPGQADKIFA